MLNADLDEGEDLERDEAVQWEDVQHPEVSGDDARDASAVEETPQPAPLRASVSAAADAAHEGHASAASVSHRAVSIMPA